MAPIRRYLRISKYSVLECRIYVDSPQLVYSWLLNPRHQDPVLPRVMESVRPLVVPKLLEEQQGGAAARRAKKKGKVKDVVVEDDFSVSIFLTNSPARHSLLSKHKTLRDVNKQGLRSNSRKMTGGDGDAPISLDEYGGVPIDVDADGDVELVVPGLRQEPESDGEEGIVNLDDVPEMQVEKDSNPEGESEAEEGEEDSLFMPETSLRGRPKKRRASSTTTTQRHPNNPIPRGRKRPRHDNLPTDLESEPADDKKKAAMDTTYTGFAIYGRVLCLVVKRREGPHRGPGKNKMSGAGGTSGTGPGAAMMEDWIASTQMMVVDDE